MHLVFLGWTTTPTHARVGVVGVLMGVLLVVLVHAKGVDGMSIAGMHPIVVWSSALSGMPMKVVVIWGGRVWRGCELRTSI